MDRGLHLHLDCPSGLAGDMFLGACLDLGLPLEVLQGVVESLRLPQVGLEVRRARRGGVEGVRVRVLLGGEPLEGPDPEEGGDGGTAGSERPEHATGHGHGQHRRLADVRHLLEQSALAPSVQERSLQLFARLAEAEAKVHGIGAEEVHFHEVGAEDSIVDVVGAVAALDHLDPQRLTCGTVVVGSGTVRTAHGELPVPAPATAELLRGLPVRGGGEGELVTPTGALLLAELVEDFVPLPAGRICGTGYGLGRREVPSRPNVCRLLSLEGEEVAAGDERGEVVVVECELDDLPGEGFGFLMERLLAAGALDLYYTPVQMKKGRPGILVTLLCRWRDHERLAALLMTESGSLGCRFYTAQRLEAERRRVEVSTPYGPVAIKIARLSGRIVAQSPEYEDCRRLALDRGVSWREVYQAALARLPASEETAE